MAMRADALLANPTLESLFAEAEALGTRFVEVTAHPGDLLADAEEALTGRADLADMTARKYLVSEGLFTRIQLLKDQLAPAAAALQREAAAGKLKVVQAEAARVKLLDNRRQFAAVGKAGGLEASLFSIQSRKTDRLNIVMMSMEQVLDNVVTFQAQMPDPARVAALVAETRALLDEQKTLRREARLMRKARTQETLQQEQLERLLLDALQHLSAQGLAAYPDDPTREARYRLDHVYGVKASVVGDPGAGGTTGVPPQD